MKTKVDTVFKSVCFVGAALGLVLAVALVCELGFASSGIWRAEGLKFLFSPCRSPSPPRSS